MASDELKCLGPCGGSRNHNTWMCDECWIKGPYICHICGMGLSYDDPTHVRKPCPEEGMGRTMTATSAMLKEDTVKASDFEDQDWWSFLPPSLQEEALASINEKIPAPESDDHSCINNIDCCDAFYRAKESDCSELRDYLSENANHDQCLTEDSQNDAVEEAKEEMKSQIRQFLKDLD